MGEKYYGYEDWDREQFARAGHVLANLAINRDAVRDARRAILRLYNLDQGVDNGEVEEHTT